MLACTQGKKESYNLLHIHSRFSCIIACLLVIFVGTEEELVFYPLIMRRRVMNWKVTPLYSQTHLREEHLTLLCTYSTTALN